METNKMPAIKNKTLGAFAAGLMAATALVATVSVLPATQAVAQNQLKADAVDPSKGFADLVDKVMPAVVSVQVKYANAAASGDEQAQGKKMPGGMEEFFKQFPQFRDMPGMPGQGGEGEDAHPKGGMAVGSGFIISADGYAVTNNHVVKDADQVSVTMKDGTEYKAEVIGTDPNTDLALIKIDGEGK
jgi:serine protease Do